MLDTTTKDTVTQFLNDFDDALAAGGNLHRSRHYSQFLSLQLKARMEGVNTPVYGLQEVRHNGR